MFYVLNLGSRSTIVVGLEKINGKCQLMDVFKIDATYSDFINNTVPEQLMQSITDFASHRYFVVCDAFYKCGTATVDEIMTNTTGDLDELKIANVCDDLLPIGLKKNEYVGTIMRRFPKTERQDFVSTAYIKKELSEGIERYFAEAGAELFGIYSETFVFTELLAALDYTEYILKIRTGKFVYCSPKGIVVCQNTAYSDEDAVSFLYSFENDLFETAADTQLQLPAVLLANKLDTICNANISGRYIPDLEQYKKEIYASLGACAAWRGKPHGRKPGPSGETSTGYTDALQKEDGKYGLFEKIRQFFAQARH